jgi:hypothetical protein
MEFTWDDVRNWYPFVEYHYFESRYTVSHSAIVFEMTDGSEIRVGLKHFAEYHDTVRHNINYAMRAPHMLEEYEKHLGEIKRSENQPPPIEATKSERKRDKTRRRKQTAEFIYDMTDIPEETRPYAIAPAAEIVARFLESKYPERHEYAHKISSYKPFKYGSQVQGQRILVRKGLLWGIKATVEPLDFQIRRLRVGHEFSPLISSLLPVTGGVCAAALPPAYVFFILHWEFTETLMLLLVGGAIGLATWFVLLGMSRVLTYILCDDKALGDIERELHAILQMEER